MKRYPLNVFYSYAHEDEAARDQLDQHLELLARRNLIVRWHDRHIVPGSEWNREIQESLEKADVIVLLVSRSFMSSAYVREVEIPNAMREHEAGRARVVPILLEDVPRWRTAAFAKIELLPSKGRAVAACDDRVAAFADIARGIGRVVKEIVIAGGGPFEFGCHEFTEAELSSLSKAERERTVQGLDRMRADLNRSVPPRRYEANLLVATWPVRALGPARIKEPLAEALFYIAQVISAFDLVALQEIDRDLHRLEALLEVLGPDWSFLITDVAPGPLGNNERFAIVYYKPRVEFRNFSGQLILPATPRPEGRSEPAEQLARPPLLAAFRSGSWDFQVCTTHITFGGGRSDALQRRVREIEGLGRYLKARSRYEHKDLLLLGDFQLEQPGSAVHQAILASGIQIPDEILLPTNLDRSRYYDLIGFVSASRDLPLGPSRPPGGTVDLYRHVLRDEDLPIYATTECYRSFMPPAAGTGQPEARERGRFRRWKSDLISDHLPLWAELAIPAAD